MMAAHACDERFVVFEGGQSALVSVVTEPTRPSNGISVLLVAGAGISSIGNARVFVTQARILAGLGFRAVRLDYRGVGESDGAADQYDLCRPFTQDAMAALRWIETASGNRVLIVGECFGARMALECAAAAPGVDALLLIAPPLAARRDDVERTRVETDTFFAALCRARRAGVVVDVLYGDRDLDLPDFSAVAMDSHGIRLTVVPGRLHGIASVQARDAISNAIIGCAQKLFGG